MLLPKVTVHCCEASLILCLMEKGGVRTVSGIIGDTASLAGIKRID